MKPRNLLPLQLFAACLVGLLLGKFCFSTSKEKVELSLFNGKLSKMQSVINIIDNRYVDAVDIDSINELVIPDILSRLDPHTSYIPAKRLNDVDKKVVGHYYGIGIEHYTINDTSTVISIVDGSPAHSSNIRPGDKIIKIDDVDVTGHNATDKVSEVIKGEHDSKAKLTIKRYGVDTLMNISIPRGIVPVLSTTAYYMIDSTTAYIKLDNFGDNSYQEFAESVYGLAYRGAENLIIDLRGNLGGRVDQARRIASELLSRGDTIVYTTGRDHEIEDVYIDTTQYDLCSGIRIACLVDGYTASAAEILSAAIQDNDRGIIIGRRTFGKGLVQTPILMQDGSQLRLTTHRYYTPSGRSLQKGYNNYDNDLSNRYKRGELDSASAFHPSDSTKYYTKNRRVVYSKCGVMPDVFVPLNRAPLPDIVHKLDSAAMTMRFAIEKYGQLGDQASKRFLKEMLDDEAKTYEELISYSRLHGISIDPRKHKKEISEAMPMIMTTLKSDVYHIIGDDNQSTKYFNSDDNVLDTAVMILNDLDRLTNILNINNKTIKQDNGKTTIIRDKDRN